MSNPIPHENKKDKKLNVEGKLVITKDKKEEKETKKEA